jgi:hypothetical protein
MSWGWHSSEPAEMATTTAMGYDADPGGNIQQNIDTTVLLEASVRCAMAVLKLRELLL